MSVSCEKDRALVSSFLVCKYMYAILANLLQTPYSSSKKVFNNVVDYIEKAHRNACALTVEKMR